MSLKVQLLDKILLKSCTTGYYPSTCLGNTWLFSGEFTLERIPSKRKKKRNLESRTKKFKRNKITVQLLSFYLSGFQLCESYWVWFLPFNTFVRLVQVVEWSYNQLFLLLHSSLHDYTKIHFSTLLLINIWCCYKSFRCMFWCIKYIPISRNMDLQLQWLNSSPKYCTNLLSHCTWTVITVDLCNNQYLQHFLILTSLEDVKLYWFVV